MLPFVNINKRAKTGNNVDGQTADEDERTSCGDSEHEDDCEVEEVQAASVALVTSSRLPHGPNVKLAEFPAMKRPETLWTGTHKDYLWPLTAVGKAHASKLVTKFGSTTSSGNASRASQATDFTHFCWACFEGGKEFLACLFKMGGSSRSNKAKHHILHTKDKKNWEGFVFNKLEDMRGQVCGRACGQATLNATGEVIHSHPPTTRTDFLDAVVAWIAATAQPLSVTENPLFREMVSVAARITSPDQLIVGSYAVRSSLLKLARSRVEEDVSFLRNKERRAFVVFDGWDGQQKVIGFSLFYVRDERSCSGSTSLSLVAVPLSFSFAKLDVATNQMSGEREVIKLLKDALADRGLPFEVLAGAKSDNAMASTIATLNRPAILHFDDEDEENKWDDLESQHKIGCLPHLVNLVVIYALGEKVAKKTGDDAIPEGPSNPDVVKIIKSAVEANEWLQNAKNFQKAELVAKTINTDLLHPALPNLTRWTSQFASIARALDNYPVLSECVEDSKPGGKVLNVRNAKALAQFEAVLEPLTVFQRVAQTTDRPFGPATLPAIAMILRRYAIACPSLLYDVAKPSADRASLLNFSVRDPEKGRITVAYDDLLSETRSLFEALQRHLVFRLVKQRSNRLLFEVLGMFADPVMKTYAKRVVGMGVGSWNYDTLRRRLDRIMMRFALTESEAAEPMAPETPCPQNVSQQLEYVSDEETAPFADAGLSELNRFLELKHPLVAALGDQQVMTFAKFLELFERHDALGYWSSGANQTSFPRLYAANLVCLAYQSSSAYEEGLFSTARMTLTDVRNRLYDSPHVAEAVVTLNHRLSREVIQKERKRIAAKSKLAEAERELAEMIRTTPY